MTCKSIILLRKPDRHACTHLFNIPHHGLPINAGPVFEPTRVLLIGLHTSLSLHFLRACDHVLLLWDHAFTQVRSDKNSWHQRLEFILKVPLRISAIPPFFRGRVLFHRSKLFMSRENFR